MDSCVQKTEKRGVVEVIKKGNLKKYGIVLGIGG